MKREPLSKTTQGYQTGDGYHLERRPSNRWAVYTPDRRALGEARGTKAACALVVTERTRLELVQGVRSGTLPKMKHPSGFCGYSLLHDRCRGYFFNGAKVRPPVVACPCKCHLEDS